MAGSGIAAAGTSVVVAVHSLTVVAEESWPMSGTLTVDTRKKSRPMDADMLLDQAVNLAAARDEAHGGAMPWFEGGITGAGSVGKRPMKHL